MKNWDYEKALHLKVGDKLQWRHYKYNSMIQQYDESKLLKTITIKTITKEFIKTNFGTYDIKTGKNTFEACGCMRFCDCYGRIELLS